MATGKEETKEYKNNECYGTHALNNHNLKELRQKIFKKQRKYSHIIIDDPYERDIEEPKFKPHEKNLNFCYFGGRKSFSLVYWEDINRRF